VFHRDEIDHVADISEVEDSTLIAHQAQQLDREGPRDFQRARPSTGSLLAQPDKVVTELQSDTVGVRTFAPAP
jgi:hypothetical protein